MEILLVKIIRSGFVEAPSAVLSGPDSGIIFPRLVHFFKRLRPFSFLDFICMADFVFFSFLHRIFLSLFFEKVVDGWVVNY